MTHDVVTAVQALTSTIRDRCVDVDRERHLPPSVVEELRDLGVFRLLAPAELGGAESDPLTFLRVVEAASYADGSVGWCVMIGGCYATFGGMLPAESAKAIFGDPSSISAGAFRPMGVAHEVDGGYQVSGRWTLGSGSSHANWFIAGCAVMRDGEPVKAPTGAPLFREVFVPRDVVEIIDTWDSTGLRGTASHDYTITDTFVPASYSCWFQEPPRCDGALYRMPPVAMFSTFISAVALGIARHAVDSFVELAVGKAQLGGANVLADRQVTHANVGRARALVGAGRAYVEDALVDLWERVQAGHAPSPVARGRLWLASTHAAQSAADAVELVFKTAGSTAVYAVSPLDRCLRDIRTATQHVTTQEGNFELAGALELQRMGIPNPWMMDYRGEDRAQN
jgi:alkylation response protein AidB-like acyl-CoA dehydrogenase